MPSQFRFHGQAVGVAGRMRTPFQEIIEVQAATALPAVGGYGSARSENFRYREILRFDAAHSVVTGSRLADEDGRPVHATLLKSTVEGLNILDMITADRIVANMVSTHRGTEDGEPEVVLVGSRFENLRIAGAPVHVDLAVDAVDRHPTYQRFQKAYYGDREVRALFGDETLAATCREAPPEVARCLMSIPGPDAPMPSRRGVTPLSLVRGLEVGNSCIRRYGNILHVSGFGVIRLCEISVREFTRGITMLQVHLGCPHEGDIGVGSGEDGGTDW